MTHDLPPAPAPSRHGTTTLRATSSLAAFWAGIGLLAVLVGDAALRGDWPGLIRWLPLALLASWVLWLALWRSSVRVAPDRVVVVNLARVHEIPWSRVAGLVQGPQIVVELEDGERVTCLGGPFPPRPSTRAAREQTAELRLLETAWESARPTELPARRYWDVPVLMVGASLAVLAVGAGIGFAAM